MLYLNKIKDLVKFHGITLKHLSNSVGISQTALQNIINNNAISVQTLEKIALYFRVPVDYFFSNEIKYNDPGANKNEVLEIEIKYLKKKIKDQEEIIKLLKMKK